MMVAGFFLLLLILIVLPFVPGIMEVRQKYDAQPLRIVQSYDVDIHHSANTFRKYINEHLAEELAGLETQTTPGQGKFEDGSEYYLLDAQSTPIFSEAELKSQVTNKMFISSSDLGLPGAMSYLNELYAAGNITGADEDIYRAMLAEKDITLGKDSMILRWMHASGNIKIPAGCILYGRASADETLTLATQSHFERLNAPKIVFGEFPTPSSSNRERRELKIEDLNVKGEASSGRWLIEDSVNIPANSIIHANLVVVGKLTVGDNCEIEGSIKSHERMQLGEGCEIKGSAVSIKEIDIAQNTKIKGPLISESKVSIESNCIIGNEQTPTTITAEDIDVQAKCLAHGTVWARNTGKVI